MKIGKISTMIIAGLVLASTVGSVSAKADPGVIVYSSGSYSDSEIYSSERDGTNAKPLTNNATFDKEPAVSQDGTKMLFAASPNAEANAGITLFDVRTGLERVLIAPEAAVDYRMPLWSPNGDAFAYTSISSDGFCIEIYKLAQGTKQRITCSGSYIVGTDWSAITNKILVGQYRGDIFTLDPVAGALPQVVITNGTSPVYSPNGGKIAFTRLDKQNLPQIFVADSNGSNQVQITSAQAVHNTVDWAADDYITYTAFDFQKISAESVRPDGSGKIVLPAAQNLTNLPGKGLLKS